MSFRWFIYYCSLLGGCAAYIGWAIGRMPSIQSAVWQASIKGMLLGLFLASVLTVVDWLWNSAGQIAFVAGLRILVGAVVGAFGGFLGGLIGQLLYGRTQMGLFLVFGWTVTGLLIGVAPGAYDLFARLSANEDATGATRKIVNGILGGTVGGIVGGLLFLLINAIGGQEGLWTPSAAGFVALGMCIGLLIGLAQVILKEAWVKVEEGFRAGRELILTRPVVTIGRAENSDIALFGDTGIEKQHACIRLEAGRYFVEDMQTAGGTFVNGQRVDGRLPLRAGDEIQVGRSILRFGERQKRPEGVR